MIACIRVTRLSEFSPIGSLFILSNFVKITEKNESLGYPFPTVKSLTKILTKNVSTTYWAIFPETHQGGPILKK
jgi:hypothetical protein